MLATKVYSRLRPTLNEVAMLLLSSDRPQPKSPYVVLSSNIRDTATSVVMGVRFTKTDMCGWESVSRAHTSTTKGMVADQQPRAGATSKVPDSLA